MKLFVPPSLSSILVLRFECHSEAGSPFGASQILIGFVRFRSEVLSLFWQLRMFSFFSCLLCDTFALHLFACPGSAIGSAAFRKCMGQWNGSSLVWKERLYLRFVAGDTFDFRRSEMQQMQQMTDAPDLMSQRKKPRHDLPKTRCVHCIKWIVCTLYHFMQCLYHFMQCTLMYTCQGSEMTPQMWPPWNLKTDWTNRAVCCSKYPSP